MLDRIRDVGFNSVYLMPWHRGGYATVDYLKMEPRLGTFASLRRFTDAAHSRGMRVLFDLLVSIMAKSSPRLKSHPDWFYRDASGRILPHPVWHGACLDPASPGFRKFLTDYAVRCCRDWGADGFRVDAAAYRGGHWHSPLGLPPHEHAHAVFTLLGEIRAAIRREKADAVLVAECFGPQQVPVSDLVGFQWVMWLDWVMERLLQDRLDGAELQRLIGERCLVMPPGTWLAGYTHNHDTLAFAKRDPEGPPVDALFTTLALLTAGLMVFRGGWGMRPRPAPREADEYRALLAARAALGGVATGELTFPPCADPALFVAERPSRLGPLRVVTNFSGAPRRLAGPGERVYSRRGSPPGELLPWDTAAVRKE
jgi:hypothetical protein